MATGRLFRFLYVSRMKRTLYMGTRLVLKPSARFQKFYSQASRQNAPRFSVCIVSLDSSIDLLTRNCALKKMKQNSQPKKKTRQESTTTSLFQRICAHFFFSLSSFIFLPNRFSKNQTGHFTFQLACEEIKAHSASPWLSFHAEEGKNNCKRSGKKRCY